MKHKLATLFTGLLAAAVLAAAPAQAHDDARRIVGSVENVVFVFAPTAECPGARFSANFDLVSRDGEPLGTGTSCVQSISPGCRPFFVGCRQVVSATFILHLPGGSVTAPMTIKERFLSESTIFERGRGRIAAGTGEFADARGVVTNTGTLTFTETGIDADMEVVIRVRCDDDGDHDCD